MIGLRFMRMRLSGQKLFMTYYNLVPVRGLRKSRTKRYENLVPVRGLEYIAQWYTRSQTPRESIMSITQSEPSPITVQTSYFSGYGRGHGPSPPHSASPPKEQDHAIYPTDISTCCQTYRIWRMRVTRKRYIFVQFRMKSCLKSSYVTMKVEYFK